MDKIDPTTLDPKVIKVMKALRSVESGDGKGGGADYNAIGDKGSSTGAFQWNNGKTPVPKGGIPINFQTDARALGFDPNDFSPANQNKVMYHKIKKQKDAGLGPEEIAAIHNGARKDANGKYIYNAPEYGVKFRNALNAINQPSNTQYPKITPENFDYGSIEDAQAEGRQHRGLELVKDFGNAVTEAPMVLGGGVLNAVTQAVGGEAKPTYTNPLGTEQNALGYRDGQELGAWETAKQGAGALAEGLSYGIGGGAVPEATQFGKASIGAYVKPAIKAGVQSGALQGFGSSLQKGDSVPVAMAKGAGTSILGGILGGGLGLGGAAYNKLAGFSPKIFNELDDAVRAGDDVAVANITSSPEYQQVLKANKYDEKAVDGSIKKFRTAIDEGIDKSYGVAKLTRAEKAEALTDDGITAMLEHMQNSNNPIADTKMALENKANDLMDEALNPILNKIRDEKLALVPLDRKSLLDDFNSRLDKTYMTDMEKERVKSYVKELLQKQNEGGDFGIVDAGIIRRNANFDFVNDKNKGAVARLLGNTMRDALDLAEKNTTSPQAKKIITHINAVNKEYSRLMQGVDVVNLMARFPGQKGSELLNKAAGFFGAGATGGNPLAYLGAHRLTNQLQNLAIRSRNNALFGDLSGKAGPVTSSELIGNAQRILNNVSGVVKTEAAAGRFQRAASNIDALRQAGILETAGRDATKKARQEAVQKNIQNIKNQPLGLPKPTSNIQSSNNVPIVVSPSTQADASRGFKGSSPLQTNLRGSIDPGILNKLAGISAAGVVGKAGYDVAADKYGKETYQREPSQPAEPFMQPVVNENPPKRGVIDGIDISKYATDPQHEVKVEKIYDSLPPIATSTEAQNYIENIKNKYGHDIKVTGDMVYKAAKEYGVSMKLMIALMQNDSMFGTTGLGKKTNNPGNIANNDAGNKQYYPTMREGVRAVARQLARYKIAQSK